MTSCPNGNEPNEKKIKVGFISRGLMNENLYDKSAYDGLMRFANETGSEIISIESETSAYESSTLNLINQNCDLIIGCSGAPIPTGLGDVFSNAAVDNPDKKFCIVDFYGDSSSLPPNVIGALFTPAHAESSFLVGFIAGKMTVTKKVGHINGIKNSVLEEFAVGYYAGVLTADPAVEIYGKYSGSFDDSVKGKTVADTYYGSGIDIIYAAAGRTGNGVIESAQEHEKWVIGVDLDQNYLAPSNVLTSAINKVDVVCYSIADSVLNKTFEGGRTLLYNLQNNGVGYTITGNHIPQNIIDEVETLKLKIISGEKSIPKNQNELETVFPGKYNMEDE
jgi:basic membrane protein A